MKYSKQALSFTKQADLLLERGLMADRDTLIDCLRSVSYYRLSAYWYTFRILNDPTNRLQPDTPFATVWDRYVWSIDHSMLSSTVRGTAK